MKGQDRDERRARAVVFDIEGKVGPSRPFIGMCRFMGNRLLPYIFLLLAYACCELAIGLGSAYLLGSLFDAVAALKGDLLVSTLIWFGLFLVTVGTIYPLVTYAIQATGHTLTGSLRRALFDHIQHLPVGHLKSTHSGEMISRLTNDVAVFERAYLEHIPNLFSKAIVVPVAIMYMAILDWRLALFAVSTAALGASVGTYYARLLERLGVQIQEGLATVTSRLSDILEGAEILRAFNLQGFLLGRFSEKTGAVMERGLERAKKEAALDGFNDVFSSASFVGLLFFGAFLSLKGEITLGVAMAVVQLENPVSDLFRNGGPMVAGLASSMAAGKRIFEVLDTPKEPAILPAPEALSSGEKFGVNTGENLRKCSPALKQPAAPYVEFKDVTFGYNPNTPVLVDVSFRVEQGQMVALVGPSGSGKSTVFNLLMGFYAPQKGAIFVGGRSIYEETLREIRQKIAFVPQDAHVFSGTVAENIGYGRPGTGMDEIILAARAANAHDFIVEMEKGYDTYVGEKGSQVSGGQRQRIAIARAILKDAPFLLLDEATSHLDPASQELVESALERLMVGRTTLVIAHRLSTVRRADKIIVLENGRVVEEGKHEELLANLGGHYWKLCQEGLLSGLGTRDEKHGSRPFPGVPAKRAGSSKGDE